MILNEFLGKSVFEGELIHIRIRCEDYCGGLKKAPPINFQCRLTNGPEN